MNNKFKEVTDRVSLISIAANLLLALFKFIAGFVAHSGAMISDAVHSASDVCSSFIVMIGARLSTKESDSEHPYGHERIECVAAIILSIILLCKGLFIGHTAIEKITKKETAELEIPGVLALIAAIVSIVVKEAMFWYTRFFAKQIDSTALMASAWHHRSDALSSIGSLIGIAGARQGHPILDPIASLVICAFIAKASYDIFMDAIRKMVDRSCDKETILSIKKCIEKQEGVIAVDSLQSRVFGNRIYVDIEIQEDGNLSLKEAHKTAEKVHHAIEAEFPKVKHITVHVNPSNL